MCVCVCVCVCVCFFSLSYVCVFGLCYVLFFTRTTRASPGAKRPQVVGTADHSVTAVFFDIRTFLEFTHVCFQAEDGIRDR